MHTISKGSQMGNVEWNLGKPDLEQPLSHRCDTGRDRYILVQAALLFESLHSLQDGLIRWQ